MSQPDLGDLGRRERQIVEALYRLERATVRDVLAELPDPPSYSAVRAMLTKLEEKGYARHEQDGPRYVALRLPAGGTGGASAADRASSPGRHLLRRFG
jgi:predicted transcriptional regulator